MAQHKYSALFELQAALGGNFSSAFKSAQAEVKSIQKEIDALNKTQADISAYTKQQTAVERTGDKLKLLQQQYDNIQKEIQETEGYSSSLENRLLSKQAAIDKTTKSYNDQTKKLDEMGKALKDAGVDTDHLAEESDRLTGEINELKQEEVQAAEKAEEFGDTGSSALRAVGDALVAAGLVEGIKKVAEGFKACFDAAATFESQMSTVQALSGASAEELDQLGAKAKELGATTEWTATQSAEAMEYMAMAGWKTNDMLSGMSGVMNLASASGEDLGNVADIVTDNLTAFGLSAQDSAHFSDVLAAAATSANTDVGTMGETFKQSAALAGTLGYSIEDVAIAVGLMANNGIKGSNAGTALKNMFSNLIDSCTLTSASFGEVEFSAVNADGTMKSWSQTLQELRGWFGQMTQAEQLANAEALVGQRAMSGFASLMNTTEDDLQSLTTSIMECEGAAEKMAAIKLDNAAGQITLLESAWDALKTTIGEQFLPVVSGAAEGLTNILSVVNEFLGSHESLTKGLIAATAAFVAVTGALGLYSVAAAHAAAISAALTAALPFLGVAAGIAAAVGVVVTAIGHFREAAANAGETAKEVAQESESVANSYYEMSDAIGGTISTEEQYTEMLEKRKEISEQLSEAISKHKQALDEYNDALKTIEENGGDTSSLAVQEELARLQENVTLAAGAVKDLRNAYDDCTGKLNEFTDAQDAAAQAEAEAAELAEKLADSTKMSEVELLKYSTAAKLVEDDLLSAEQAAKAYGLEVDNLNTYMSNQQDKMDATHAALILIDEGYMSAEAAASKFNLTADDLDTGRVENFKDALSNLQTKYSELYTAAYNSLSGQFELWDKAEKTTATSMSTLQKNLQSQVEYWKNYNSNLSIVSQAAQDAGIDISGIWGSLSSGSSEAVSAVAGMAQAIQSNAGDGTAALQDYVDTYAELQDAIGETATTITDNSAELQDALTGVWDSISGSLDDAELVEKFSNAASDSIQGFMDSLSARGDEPGQELSTHAQSWIDSMNAALGVASPSTITNQSGVDTIQGFVNGVDATAPSGVAAMQNAANSALNAFKALMNNTALYSAGAAALQGAINGINSMIPSLVAKAREAGQKAAAAYKEAQDINSPSKLFEWFSVMDMEGAIKGLEKSQNKVNAAFRSAAVESAQSYMSAPTYGSLALEAPAEAGSGSYSVSVNFNIDGNADANTIRGLRGFAGDFVDQVRMAINEINGESLRRSWAR